MTARVIKETQVVSEIGQEQPRRVVQTTTRVVPSLDDHPAKTFETKKAIFRTYQVLYYLLGIIETLIGFRFLLKLIGASTTSTFTDFIYATSRPFASPFLGVVPTTVSGRSVIEWSTLIAMAVYAVLVWLIVHFFQIVKPVGPEEVGETVDNP